MALTERPGLRVLTLLLAFGVLLSPEAALAKGKKKPPVPAAPKDEAAPVITHTPPPDHDGVGPLQIHAVIDDASTVFEPTLVVRSKGGAYARVPMTQSDPAGTPNDWSAAVPAELLVGDLEYFIEAFDEHGNGPGRAGEESAPLWVGKIAPLPVEPAQPPPVEATPAEEDGGNTAVLVGAGIAVGVVVLLGAGAAVGFIAYNSREKPPQSTKVTISGPAPIAGFAP